jgi:dienelactone hydrolase
MPGLFWIISRHNNARAVGLVSCTPTVFPTNRTHVVRNSTYRAGDPTDHPQETSMAEVLLFHHALGLTPGVIAFADELRAAGHTVHTPDLYDGKTFGTLEEGMANAKAIGFEAILDRSVALAEDLPSDLVYAGMSLGEMAAQKLAQTRPGARGALLFYSCIPIRGEWAFGPWPDGVPVQIHGMDADPIFAGEGDVDAAREIVDTVADAELFLYPGDQHYFADSSLPSYDAEASALLLERVKKFLATI